MLQSLRLYYDLWMTQYDQSPETYGFYQNHTTKVSDKGEEWYVTNPIFFENPGEKHYVVGYEDKDLLGGNFFTNKPLYLSSVVKYAYNGKKVFFSFSWQSYLMSGLSALGLSRHSSSNTLLPLFAQCAVKTLDPAAKLHGYPRELLCEYCQLMAVHIVGFKPQGMYVLLFDYTSYLRDGQFV